MLRLKLNKRPLSSQTKVESRSLARHCITRHALRLGYSLPYRELIIFSRILSLSSSNVLQLQGRSSVGSRDGGFLGPGPSAGKVGNLRWLKACFSIIRFVGLSATIFKSLFFSEQNNVVSTDSVLERINTLDRDVHFVFMQFLLHDKD